MGLSLSVLIALFLILPGAAFVFGLARHFDETRAPTVIDQYLSTGLAVMLVSAIALHAVSIAALSLLSHLFGSPEPAIAQVVYLLAGTVTGEEGKSAIASLLYCPLCIALYFLAVSAFGWLLGTWCQHVWDPPSVARWDALLEREPDVAFIWLTVDLQVGPHCYLYAGVLKDFNVGKDGHLSRVVLLGAVRKLMDGARVSNNDLPDNWVEIPGESCVLQMKSNNTVNIDYFFVGDPETAADEGVAIEQVELALVDQPERDEAAQ